jgi:hypothetical protein
MQLPLTPQQARRIATTFCTSHTAVTNFDRCPRKRFIENYWDGYGIVSAKPSMPLLVGAATHVGVEVLNRTAMDKAKFLVGRMECLKNAIKQAKTYYTGEAKAYIANLSRQGQQPTTQEKFSFNEGMALVEGMVWVYFLKVLPGLLQGYNILAVEKEHDIRQGEVVYQARIDAIVEDATNHDIYAWSLKTVNGVDSRKKKFHEHDSQGMAESWVLEDMLQHQKMIVDAIRTGMAALVFGNKPCPLEFPALPDHCTGVKMCFLLKGKEWDETPEYEGEPGLTYTNSPLVRAFRRQVGDQVQYAHSKKFPNPDNKSGYGILGKGWEPFYPWQEMKIATWIGMLAKGDIQPECGDVLDAQTWMPVAYMRYQCEVGDWVEQTLIEEERVKWAITSAHKSTTFKQNRAACHYPTDCPCIPICFNPQMAMDPVGSGWFKQRIPHHETELRLHQQWMAEDSAKVTESQLDQKRDLEDLADAEQFATGAHNEVGEEILEGEI